MRYFEAFSKKQHVLEPLSNENELVDLIHARTYTKTEKIYMETLDLAVGKISYGEFESQLIELNKS